LGKEFKDDLRGQNRTFIFYILTPWQKERRISNGHQNDVVIDVTFRINAKIHDGVS
jgi:hypothetical protein